MSGERTPLLAPPAPSPKRSASAKHARHVSFSPSVCGDVPPLSLESGSRAVAALRAGKLPSSEQASLLLHSILHSSFFTDDAHTPLRRRKGQRNRRPRPASGVTGTGTLSAHGELVRQRLRAAIVAGAKVVNERMKGDSWQELVYRSRKAELELSLPQRKLPGLAAQEKERARQSIVTVAIVVLTSAKLRSLLLDLLSLLKDGFSAATQSLPGGDLQDADLQKVVDGVVNGDAKGKGKMENAVEPTPTATPAEPAQMDHESFQDRFQEILMDIQGDSSYQAAVLNLLQLLRSFIAQLLPSQPTISSTTSSSLSDIAELLVVALEPFTGGKGSLSPLLEALKELRASADDVADNNRFKRLLSLLDSILERALLEVHYLGSSRAQRDISKLYKSLVALGEDSPEVRERLTAFVAALIGTLQALAGDKTLGRLVGAIEGVGEAIGEYALTAGRTAFARRGLWGDLIEWVVPRALAVVKEVPLPRIEYASELADVAVDPPNLLASHLVPDQIAISTSSYLSFEPEYQSSKLEATTKLSIQGLRLQTLNIGYFAAYKGAGCCGAGVQESGLLDILIGDEDGGGVGLEIEFNTESSFEPARGTISDDGYVSDSSRGTTIDTEADDETPSLWRVLSSKAKIRHFDIRPHMSDHPWLLFFLRPLMRWIIRWQLEKVVAEQMETLMTSLGESGHAVKDRAEQEEAKELPPWLRWGHAIWTTVVGNSIEEEEEEDDEVGKTVMGDSDSDDSEEDDEGGGTEVHITSKGIQLDIGGSGEQIIGVGAEGVAITDEDSSTPVPRPGVKEILSKKEHVAAESGKEVVVEVASTLEDFGQAIEGYKEQKAEEKTKRGWRSAAFDFGRG